MRAVYSFEQRLKAGKYVMRQTSIVNDEASLFPSRSLFGFTRFYCKDLNVAKMNQLKVIVDHKNKTTQNIVK